RLDVPLDDAEAHDEQAPAPNWLERLLRGFTNTDGSVPAPVAPDSFTSGDFRQATEEVILRLARTGRGVILGRGSVIVLRKWPSVFRVRLDGPPERRLQQAMALGDHDRPTAEAAMRRLDRTQAEYGRQLYGMDIGDPSLYHLVIDSTSVEVEACVDVIARAARSLVSTA
ncbi:MAG TPA: cytidylate kinase-like family protein, partial [Solirubrobacteraceae bacterium]|nr:cytidylate kinase-like family protein [Solirubrobacteraceae bacterium]